MNRILAPSLALAAALALAGCGNGFKKTFGLTATPPDAFQVGTQAPLSLPPELGVLPQPNPGEPRPQQVDAAQDGANIISASSAIAAPDTASTPGQSALLDAAGPTPPASIRADVNQNALIASKPQGFVNQLMGTPPAPEPTVDAAAEARRLQENAAMGQPVTTGSTPQQSNAKPGFFQRVLNIF